MNVESFSILSFFFTLLQSFLPWLIQPPMFLVIFFPYLYRNNSFDCQFAFLCFALLVFQVFMQHNHKYNWHVQIWEQTQLSLSNHTTQPVRAKLHRYYRVTHQQYTFNILRASDNILYSGNGNHPSIPESVPWDPLRDFLCYFLSQQSKVEKRIVIYHKNLNCQHHNN